MSGEPQVRVLARAKINLHLSVEGLRPDGYHDLEMVMQTVDLFDELTMTPAAETTVTFRWMEGVRGETVHRPDLVEGAVRAYGRRAATVGGWPWTGAGGATVEVRKRIPLASGMAGGSADAAAALLGMDALAGGRLSPELPGMAASIGSDVPFALVGGTCVARGRGEVLEPLPSPARLWWVLGISAFGIGTPGVFRRHDEQGPADGPSRAGIDDLLAALAAGEPEAIAARLRNDLAAAARAVEPRLEELERTMRAAAVLGSVVTGSGPTVAGLCRDEAHAREAAARVRGAFDRVEVVVSTPAGAEVLGSGPTGPTH
jgi:4-diphosphocytidyl-2-C-methyl-D-erythritol kinase